MNERPKSEPDEVKLATVYEQSRQNATDLEQVRGAVNKLREDIFGALGRLSDKISDNQRPNYVAATVGVMVVTAFVAMVWIFISRELDSNKERMTRIEERQWQLVHDDLDELHTRRMKDLGGKQ